MPDAVYKQFLIPNSSSMAFCFILLGHTLCVVVLLKKARYSPNVKDITRDK